ncbi:hypothetical protein CBR_g8224 [Chara braunii]|uniref:Lon N-terminal domain-containing protein n=1 Tax=Chara braunii TaxID=69332 RepID=A0A388KLK3_CHABU|nr:hypothetical protein CBR_g8224 [Chara braunii]|eukprot:GBG70922.1 hypothetical protein CBR_g8224 [Chara braunii]
MVSRLAHSLCATDSRSLAASGANTVILGEANDLRRSCSGVLATTSGVVPFCGTQCPAQHGRLQGAAPFWHAAALHSARCPLSVFASWKSRCAFSSCRSGCSALSLPPLPSSLLSVGHVAGNAVRSKRGGGGGGANLGRRCSSSSSSSSSSSNGDRASSDDGDCARGDDLVELPLFPLPLVLFPDAVLPLQIFEYRYRIMMHTLLETELRFGVIYSGKESGNAAPIGCVGEIVKHERLADDRFFLICRGQQRFKVVDIVRTKPYLVGKVAWLEDVPTDQPEDLEALAADVESLMKDVIRLSNKISGKPDKEVPEDLRKKTFPTPFSFWVASTFEGAPVEQQSLLELEDTAERLKRERDTLRNTLNYLSAATAVKDVFSSSSSSSD